MSNKWTVFLFSVLLSGPIQAKVFDFGQEGFAPYIGGQYLTFTNADGAFANSSGAGNTYDKSLTTGLSYEFGFAYAIKKFRLVFAFQYLKPPQLYVAGTNTGGAQYSFVNETSAMIPKVGFELSIKEWKESRLFFEGQYGSASLTTSNNYTFTAGGTDFKEELKGSGSMMAGGIGFEINAFDSTTLMLSLGYRSLNVSSLKHNLPVTGFQGAVAKGDPATTNDGTARSQDLSGYYASVFFRFWIF